jgi:hypothetical protein
LARILLDEKEIAVSEAVEAVLNRIVNSRDGLRRGSGAIVAPPGWVILTSPDTDGPIYVQVARIGWVRED